jgi:hypothetical protein
MTKYRCNHCGQIVRRASRKRWMTSFCDPTGKLVRLWRVNWRKP